MVFNSYVCIYWYALLTVGSIRGVNSIKFVQSVFFWIFLFFQDHSKILMSCTKFN
jgi:hypothetical protein